MKYTFYQLSLLVILISGLCNYESYAQIDTLYAKIDTLKVDTVAAPRPNYKLLRGIFAAQSVLYLGTLYGLSKSWYKTSLTTFTVKDDTYEWLQLDKMGHVYTSYQIARHTAAIYATTGISKKQMLIYGGISGIIFQTPIEILDGFSPDYGFSPGDMIANVAGSLIFVGQMAFWDEIKIQPKFSAHLTSYAVIRPGLLGQTYSERMLKDYNGQTYWFSASPGSFAKGGKWPSWLCFSVGYGIDNMVAASAIKSYEMGKKPVRQFYLSVDIDLTKIKTKNKAVRAVAFIANSIKVPAPAFVFSKNGIQFKPLYF